ncbi:conserved hypothetical protein [Vibrio chagasii]|nr:conserved hypothetical protein [Vibrio chagasii]
MSLENSDVGLSLAVLLLFWDAILSKINRVNAPDKIRMTEKLKGSMV